jgi:thioredoxin-related protein
LGLPAVVFVDSKGKTLATPRVAGFVDAKEFLKMLQEVK